MLEPGDQPAILLHFETLAQSRGMESISFQVPSINVVVMNHLLERGYKIDAPPGLLMSSEDFGRFDCLSHSRRRSCCESKQRGETSMEAPLRHATLCVPLSFSATTTAHHSVASDPTTSARGLRAG